MIKIYENNIKLIDEYMNVSLSTVESPLNESMKYSLFAGGKRLRPQIILLIGQELGIREEKLLPFCAGIEMIHTYSLIHDDLPCLDNDDLRRGKPTCHKIFGEANALLAGDALLNYSYELILNNISSKAEIEALKILANHSGVRGMIGGQVMDIISEKMPIGENELRYIHENKTGKLLTASFIIPFILANKPKEDIEKVYKAGMNYGVSFQVLDDILDVISTDEVLGKPVGSDEKNNKCTYVTLYGIDKAKEDYKGLKEECLNMLKEVISVESNAYKFILSTFDREF